MTSLLGMKVLTHYGRVPKLQLSEDVPVSPEMRRQFNAWALDFFGTTPVIPDGQVLVFQGNILCNPDTFVKMSLAFPKGVRNEYPWLW